MASMVRIKSVAPLKGFTVRLQFSDGTQRDVNLEPYLVGPIFEPMRSDPAIFRSVKVDAELGTVVWDNGADIDPDVLYRNRIPARMAREEKTG